MYFEEELKRRKLPELMRMNDESPVTPEKLGKRREELLEVLQKEEYGMMPPPPEKIWGEIERLPQKRDFAGKGQKLVIRLHFLISGKEFSFPFILSIPHKKDGDEKKLPLVVMLNFRPDFPDEYIPAEEIIDRGTALASFCYKDVTSDDGDFTNGFAGILFKDGERKENTDCGKIVLWAYCASRVLDYVLEAYGDRFDMSHIAVCGHSRLGKTALVAGAFDTRFTHAYSNCSGCSGAAITRRKAGETVEDITMRFPFWFCPRYAAYAGKENELPFEQHFLMAAIAPRKVYVASAEEDTWADPASEHLCCHAASEMWKAYGLVGFVSEDRAPVPGDVFHKGDIGYHERTGAHYFSREDWNKFLDFFLS